MQNIKHILQKNPLQTLSGNPAKGAPTSISMTNQNHLPTATSLPSKNAEQDAKRMDVLFLRFSVIYGYLWQKTYQNEALLKLAKKEWQISLRSFDNQTIKAALAYCREFSPFPPTLPAFIEQCKTIVKRNTPYTPFVIEGKRASIEAAEVHLQKIRHLLNMPPQGENQC